MISFATPILTDTSIVSPTPSSQVSTPDSPTSARSRRYALLPPPPSPQPPAPQPPPPPPPPLTLPPLPVRSPLRPTARSPSEPHTPSPDPALSKRKHALLELLSSERAYASDLALIRDIHIPLAQGLPSPFLASTTESPISPSTPQFPQTPPMSKEDTRIIFGNVGDLAVFSEVFCHQLEEALKGVLDPDGDGKDNVAEVFLSMIPHMKPPYTTYITRHPGAVAHLNALPQTPALTSYLAQTHTLAQSYTHAWDLPSLLIKPVQRLLKYPLLLGAIIDDTEPGEAKEKLREARDKVEEVARGVNEGRRRLEVVKNLLDGKHPPPVRLKSIRNFNRQRSGSKDEQGHLESLEKRLHDCEAFVRDFAKDVVDWSMSIRDTVSQLERWSISFGRVIGLGQLHGSEALDLFTEIISCQMIPIWVSLDTAIQSTLLPKLGRLLATTAKPLLLLEHVHALRPQHLQLLDSPISKARPPQSLVDASQSFLALDAQLRTELPRYIALLERGFMGCLAQFADWQARFWREIRASWVELWDALGVEGDMTAGAADTVKVWWERWSEADATATQMRITRPVKRSGERTSTGTGSTGPTGPAAVLATAFVAGPTPAIRSSASSTMTRQRRHSMQSINLDLDVVGIRLGPGDVIASPESYGAGSRESDRISVGSRWEHDRQLMRSGSTDRPGTIRRDSDLPSTRRDSVQTANSSRGDSNRATTARTDNDRSSRVRREIKRPSTARPDTARRDTGEVLNGVLKKSSLDSTFNPSHRLSVHTSGSGGSSSNHRMSTQSIDVHVGMDMHVLQTQRPASRTSISHTRPPVASLSDLVSAASGFVPVLPPSDAKFSKKPHPLVSEMTEERGRDVYKKPSIRKRFADAFRSPSKRPHPKQSLSSPNIITTRAAHPPTPVHSPPVSPLPYFPPTLYTCTVVHPFTLPGHTLPFYRNFPFLPLQVGDTLFILTEEGHPRDHDDLPIRPEDENCDDCLLFCRDEHGGLGWALASFLIVIE